MMVKTMDRSAERTLSIDGRANANQNDMADPRAVQTQKQVMLRNSLSMSAVHSGPSEASSDESPRMLHRPSSSRNLTTHPNPAHPNQPPPPASPRPRCA